MIQHKIDAEGRVELPITAAEAKEIITRQLAHTSGAGEAWRAVNDVRARLAAISPEKPVYIFNVSPMAYSDYINPVGKYSIPPCGLWERVSPPLIIPGFVIEPVPFVTENGLRRFTALIDTGRQIAETILGIARHGSTFNNPHVNGSDNNLVSRGCFMSDVNPPREEDIIKARAALRQWVNGFLGDPPPTPPGPLTFWQRIKSFFR